MNGVTGVNVTHTNQIDAIERPGTQSTFGNRMVKIGKGITRVLGAIVTLGISEIVIRMRRARRATTRQEDMRANRTLNPQQDLTDEIREANREKAEQYAMVGEHGEDYLGLQFAVVRQNCHFGVRMSEVVSDKLENFRNNIRTRIENADHIVDRNEALNIVKEEAKKVFASGVVKKIVGELNEEFGINFTLPNSLANFLESNIVQEIDRGHNSPADFSNTVREIVKRRFIDGYNVKLADRYSDTSSDKFQTTYREVSRSLGFDVNLSKLDKERLSSKIGKAFDRASRNASRPLTDDEAERITREQMTSFIQNKQSLVSYVDSINLTNTQKASLKTMILGKKIEDKALIDTLLELQPAFEKMINGMESDDQEESFRTVANTLKELKFKIHEYEQTKRKQALFDDVVEYSIKLFIDSHGGDVQAQRLYNSLASKESQDMIGAFREYWLGNFNQSDEEQKASASICNFTRVLTSVVANILGIMEPPVGTEASLTEFPEHVQKAVKNISAEMAEWI